MVSKLHVVLACLCLVFLTLGIVGVSTVHRLFSHFIAERIPIVPGSESYDGWVKIPFPIYQRFYYFNLTNPVEFLAGTQKPNFVEVGPYTWRSEWTKEPVEWNANGTVLYREKRRFWFDRNSSHGDQDDVITTINAPLLAASQRVRKMSPVVKVIVSLILDKMNETIIIQKSIRELTFEGYKDMLAEFSHILDRNTPVKDGKFAYMAGKNDTDEGVFNVFTGGDNIRDINRIDMWNGRNKLPWWDSNSSCADIKGTNGELNSPIESGDENIYFFTPSFCKPWKLTRERDDVESRGLKLTRFVAGPEVFFNSTKDPKHKCFEQPGNSLPSGGMDISRCQFGLPLVLSYPHFYAADKEYIQKVDGLSPNESLHKFIMDIEPNLGITLGLKARAQVNIKLSRVSFLKHFKDVPEVVLPIFWQEMDIQQTEPFAVHIQQLVVRPMLYTWVAFIVMLSFAVLCTIALSAYIALLHWRNYQKDRQPLLSNDEVGRQHKDEDSDDQTAGERFVRESTPPPNYDDDSIRPLSE